MQTWKVAGATLLAVCVLSACSKQVPEDTQNIRNDNDQTDVTFTEGYLPHYKYELDNGLTVILHQDTSDPLVNVNITYHVGSAREDYGRSGFAHFFEHMMFQGSQNVADEEHFKLITEAGGNLNGSTNSDITNYYQTVPANQLETVLWLEADRMGFLLPAVTQEKFENQRETVKNERGQRVDNQPYGLRGERTGEALYPVGHPYSWSVIGYVEDLDRVGLNDLKAFFQRWYGPNNATLTIGGDIDVAQTKAWVEKYFGTIPRGPEVEPADKQPGKLDENRYVTLEDKVHLPLLQLTYPTVYANHADEPALDVLADILGNGKTSLLYKNMVKNGLAVQALAFHPCRELACEFQMLALANPQSVKDLKQLNRIMQSTLAEFEERGVQPDDLQRVKSRLETDLLFGLQSVAGKVFQLANSETYKGQPDTIESELARYNAVTADDVMRVYNQYVKEQAAVILSIVPEGKADLVVAEQNFELPERQIPESPVMDDITQANIDDAFDRSVKPSPTSAKPVSVPNFWRETFDNGVQVVGVTTDETPTVNITINMEGGVFVESLDQLGVASMTAQMMNESTKNFTNEELANELALIGSSISFGSSGRYSSVYVSSLSKNIAQTMALLEEKLMNPAFNEDDFQRVKQSNLQSMQQSLKNPSVLASRARDMLTHGEESRYGLPDSGTLESLAAITLDDVKAYYTKYYRPNYATVLMSGDLSKASTLTSVKFLKNWESQAYEIPMQEALGNVDSSKIFIVDKPKAPQSVVNIFRPAMTFDAFGEYYKARLANFPLGGMFNSRINLNLREDKGYTYGARTGFSGGKTTGTFLASADVTGTATAESVIEFLSEMDTYQQSGMTAEELAFMQVAFSQSEALDYETPRQKGSFVQRLVAYDLPNDYVKQQQEILANIDVEELNAVASKWYDTSKMAILIVGDAESLTQSLAPLAKELNRDIEVIEIPQ